VSTDENHVALPKLFGAPAYSRPPRIYDESPRPVDEDDLPIEALRTDEDLALLTFSTGRSAGGGAAAVAMRARPSLEARPFSLKSFGRLLSGR
jgi:hypothetical protein